MDWSPVVSGVVAALGALAGAWVGSRSNPTAALSAEATATREESMRLLRWATELAVLEDPMRSRVGVEILRELLRGGHLTSQDKAVVAGVLRSILAPSIAAYAESKEVPNVRPDGDLD